VIDNRGNDVSLGKNPGNRVNYAFGATAVDKPVLHNCHTQRGKHFLGHRIYVVNLHLVGASGPVRDYCLYLSDLAAQVFQRPVLEKTTATVLNNSFMSSHMLQLST
jgi:hypothetical protein